MICWSEVRLGVYKNIHFARRWNYEYDHTLKHYPNASNQPVYIELNGGDCLLLRHKAGQEGRGEILLENSFKR